jgi:hypothetical protein
MRIPLGLKFCAITVDHVEEQVMNEPQMSRVGAIKLVERF